MNVLYCGDKNIADGLIISVLSLTKHVREPLNIFVLTMCFSFNGRACEPLSEDLVKSLDIRAKQVNKESSVKGELI